MARATKKSRSIAKELGAFAFLLALVLVVVAGGIKFIGKKQFAVKNPLYQKIRQHLSQREDLGSEPLFYRSIGHAPRNFLRKKSQKRISNKTQFTLEIAVVNSKGRATQMLAKLAKRGIKAYYTPMQSSNGRVVYRVRTGVFRSQRDAIHMAKKLKSSRNLKTRATKLQ